MTDSFGKFDGKFDAKPGEKSDVPASPFADMMEATRLTGLGRLAEASALIQRSLAGHPLAQTLGLAPEPCSRTPVPDIAPDEAPPAPDTVGRVRAVMGGVARGLAPVLKGLAPARASSGRTIQPGGRFVEGAFAAPAGARDYKLFIPSDPIAPAPLVVMLHGCTQSPDDFAAGTGMNALAERAGIFVAYPAQSRSAHAQRCWNWYEPRDQGREAGEPAIIAGLTRAVMAAHAIDPARVYIAGLSAGGAAAANIAHAYPDLYAALGVHSGLAAGCARDLGSALMAMQGGAPGLGTAARLGASTIGPRIPTIVFHGEDDGTVSARNADQVLAQAGAAGLAGTSERFEDRGHPFTRTRYADASGRVLVEDWRVHGAGHAWSGGHPEGSFTDADGPDASRAMLDFFAGHRLGPAGR